MRTLLSHDVLDARLRALPTPPRDGGLLELVVARHPDGRLTPARGRFSRAGGLEGDRWVLGKAKPVEQISVMRTAVARVVAAGQPLQTFGDNLFVDLDLHADALLAGTVLRIGSARFVVSDEPHTGCRLFRDRFGLDALALLSRPEWRPYRLRGVYFTVLEDGEAGPGDAIVVERRP